MCNRTTSQKDSPNAPWFGFSPGLPAASYAPALENPDWVVFGATANGTVPCGDNDYSLLPTIENLVDRGIPVFIVPDLNSASFNADGISRIDLTHPYESHIKVIRAGGRLLLKDSSQSVEISSEIVAAYRAGLRGLELSDAICEKFNTPNFNLAQQRIREIV